MPSPFPQVPFISFFFNDPATTEIYTLSLHDALPIWSCSRGIQPRTFERSPTSVTQSAPGACRSEEHTSELQSHSDLVCRLLLEKKKKLCHQQSFLDMSESTLQGGLLNRI